MTDPTEAPCSPLRWLDELLAGSELRALSRSLIGAAYERARVTLPRLATPERPVIIRASGVLIETARATPAETRSAAIVVFAWQALGLVDRVLGGRGEGYLPPAEPSSAECGVLAYGAARVLGLLTPELRLVDVHLASRQELSDRMADHVWWPLMLHGEAGELGIGLVLSRDAARELDVSFAIRLVLRDAVSSEALDGLAPGAVLVSDRWTLSATSEGWAGPVEVLVPEADHCLLKSRLERGAVTCAADFAELEAEQVALVLTERRVSLYDLAAIGAGELPAFTDVQLDSARLERAGQLVAEGRLGVFRGGLAFTVTRCGSAASPGHPHG